MDDPVGCSMYSAWVHPTSRALGKRMMLRIMHAPTPGPAVCMTCSRQQCQHITCFTGQMQQLSAVPDDELSGLAAETLQAMQQGEAAAVAPAATHEDRGAVCTTKIQLQAHGGHPGVQRRAQTGTSIQQYYLNQTMNVDYVHHIHCD